MTPKEMMEQFDMLYESMTTSKDVAMMKHFGATFKQMFGKVAVSDAKLAMETLNLLSAMEYNNFVTMEEAVEVASHFINDDMRLSGATSPTKGAHWPADVLKNFLNQKGLPIDDKPYYNWPALWLAVNMIYSDFADAIVDIVGDKSGEKMAETSYKLALRKLKDRDRPDFIREYFELDD